MFPAVGGSSKPVLDSGLRKKMDEDRRLGQRQTDSCLGGLEGKREARPMALMAESSGQGMHDYFSWTVLWSYLTLSNRPSAEPRRPPQKGSEHVLPGAPELKREDSKGGGCICQGQGVQQEPRVSS